MTKLIFIAGAFMAAMVSVPAAAVDLIIPLGVIIVPPTQTFTPGVTFATAGANSASFTFTISQANTLTTSSFTNSSIGGTGVFNFTSIGLYSGFGTTGTLLQSGGITTDGNTRRASLNQFALNAGNYTISYAGTVVGAPAGVGSDITFAAGAAAVPEPASWAMMIVGVGMAGGAMRRRKSKVRTTIKFA